MADEDQVPEEFLADGKRWVRTTISRGRDLIDGRQWVASFKRRCDEFKASKAAAAATGSPGGQGEEQPRRRLLRQVASNGDQPQYWKRSDDLPPAERNRLLEQMSAPAGIQERLPTGEEVILWFNVANEADDVPPVNRVFVTSAHCPHQGVCLAGGELQEIEDLNRTKHPVIRCPRHNRLFDLRTGEGQGNFQNLRCYPARFVPEFKRFYVAVDEAPQQQEGLWLPRAAGLRASMSAAELPSAEALVSSAPPSQGDDATMGAAPTGPAPSPCLGLDDPMDVEVVEEPLMKRLRPTDTPTPVRALLPHRTVG